MKLKKTTPFVFKTGRNILDGFESLNDFSNKLSIKSIEGKNEKLDFKSPLSIADVKKLFDLEIDTDYFNPVYLQEKLGLEIRDDNFLESLKSSKEAFKSFNQIIEDMKTQIVENTIILPEEAILDDVVIGLAMTKIQDMIKKSNEKMPVSSLVVSLNEYRERLEATIELSQKTVDILKGNSLFDKGILDVKEEIREMVIKKKEELILQSQQLLKDMSVLAQGLDEVVNIVEKGNEYNNGLFNNNKFNHNVEVASQINLNR